jgi:hypothetical protein
MSTVHQGKNVLVRDNPNVEKAAARFILRSLC